MDRETRLKRLLYRSHHRGTREADYMIGGFFDARAAAGLDDAGIAWFEALVDEDDVEIMAWALGTAEAPAQYQGPLLKAMQHINYVTVER